MKALAIVQARIGSTRVPYKVMLPINGVPLIELLLHRLALAKRIDHIVVATSTAHGDKPLAAHVRGLGVEVVEGSENNVLDRFYNAAKEHQPEIVLRITGDRPLVNPELVDEMAAYFGMQNVEYLSNVAPPTFPDGLDIEVFSVISLEQAACSAGTPAEREHVTPFIRESGRFTTANFTNRENLSHERWTVDQASDLEVVKVSSHFSPRLDSEWSQVMKLRKQHPKIHKSNQLDGTNRPTRCAENS